MLSCEYCGKPIKHRSPAEIKRAKHHFCSRECRGKWERRRVKYICLNCGKEFEDRVSSKRKFCSRKCQHEWQKKKKLYTCLNCGKTFKDHPSAKRKFCSRKCQIEFIKKTKTNRVHVNCDYCGKEIVVKPSKLKENKHIFCSRECYAQFRSVYYRKENHPNWKGGHPTVRCDYCGKEFKTWKRSIDGLNFCSYTCYWAWRSDNIRGRNHPLWKGGSDEWRGSNWGSQRRKALKRDNYSCRLCGSKEDLVVHHIIPFRVFGAEKYREANKLSNLITLCRSCHGKVEMGKLKLPHDIIRQALEDAKAMRLRHLIIGDFYVRL